MTSQKTIWQDPHDRKGNGNQSSYIWRFRENRRTSHHHNFLAKIGLIFCVLISLIAALFSISIALSYTKITEDLPSIEILPSLLESSEGHLIKPTTIYDRNGEHVLLILQNPSSTNRQYLHFVSETSANNKNTTSIQTPKGELPKNLVLATLAVSDPHFWDHPGFSFLGKFREHPTLAQRLVSDFLLYNESPGLYREIRERLLAAQITSRFGREKILEWYLNSADYGRFAFGADAASLLYFSKSGSNLSLGEAALLAGVSEAPDLNPIDAPQIALDRQKFVIQELMQHRMITPKEGLQAAQEELDIKGLNKVQTEEPGKSYNTQSQTFSVLDLEPKIASAFSQWVLRQSTNIIPMRRLQLGGFDIISTLDIDLQNQTSCAIEAQREHILSFTSSNPISGDSNCQAARFLPTLLPQVWQVSSSPDSLEIEVVILDPITGQILALVGEPPVTLGNAPLLSHPAGTIVTPFIYLTAFSRGYSPASLVWDVPAENQESVLENIDEEYHGPIRMRIALANDYLLPAGKILKQIGEENVLRIAEQLGISHPKSQPGMNLHTINIINSTSSITSTIIITSPNDLLSYEGIKPDSSVLSLFRSINLVEITQVFGVLDNHGILTGKTISTHNQQYNTDLEPIYPEIVLRIEDSSRRIYQDPDVSTSRPIITPQLAHLMTHSLSDEAARWLSFGHPNALEIGRPVAVKIGRTPSGNSNWTIGYTPQRVVGVWIGDETQKPISEKGDNHLIEEATFGLWHAIIQYASQNQPYLAWTTPPGINSIQVCDPSGLLPTNDCPNIVEEIFLSGSEPIETDSLFRTIPINYETGNLATLFTPPDLVENHTYFMFPQEASKWANQEGIETPPEVYDLLPATLPGQPGAQILSPAMFDIVHKNVTLFGDADGDGFAFYRVQVGESLFPKSWFQVGEDVTTPVNEGKLAVWDTKGLSGLYAIQLLVVKEDQSTKRITTMVTVDNTPPDVQILYPNNEEELQASELQEIVFQTKVDDNLGIENVKFYLDGQLFATILQPPYSLSWITNPGRHTLRVLATDLANNSTIREISFIVQG